MKVYLVTSMEIPGGLRIEAETPAEAMVLRMFTNDKRQIYIASSGGNILEDRVSFLICHTENLPPTYSVVETEPLLAITPRKGE